MKDVVIASACRTAIGAFGGSLRDSIAAKIAATAMSEAIKRAGINASTIDDVRFGCCMEPVDTLNVARIAALLAGIPDTVPAVTINRVCISGIGLGHPVGAIGARIMVTLIHAMRKKGNTLGLATLCGGGGVSMACAIEMI